MYDSLFQSSMFIRAFKLVAQLKSNIQFFLVEFEIKNVFLLPIFSLHKFNLFVFSDFDFSYSPPVVTNSQGVPN